MRIGIFGGTFDPIHNAHLLLAETAQREYRLDLVIFVPCHQQPLKDDRPMASDGNRLRMLELALENRDDWRISDLEIRRGGTSYTFDTLIEIRRSMGEEHEYFLLIGGDSGREFDQWYRAEEIAEMAQVVVAPRDGFSLDECPERFRERFQIVHMPRSDISATQVRSRLTRDEDIEGLVPEKVRDYIERRRLYRG